MNADDDMIEYITADWHETLAEALAYFEEQFKENKAICAAWGRVYWDLYDGIGYQDDEDGHTFSGDCDTLREWIGNLSLAYDNVTALDLETGEELWTNEECIYASDHKAAIVGKEVAHYV